VNEPRLITIREFDDTSPDDIYPGLDASGNLALAPDEDVVWRAQLEVRALDRHVDGGRWRTSWEMPSKAEVTLTGDRLVYVIRKYTKGSTYTGGIVVDTLLMTAVSKTRAAVRRHGNAAVGQIRCEWVTSMFVGKAKGFFTRTCPVGVNCLQDDHRVHVRFRVPAESALPVADCIAQTFASGRLRHRREHLEPEEIEALDAYAAQPVRSQDSDGEWTYLFPGALMVGHR
jgi:hypothetical protein